MNVSTNAWRRVLASIALLVPAFGLSQQTDTLCPKVMSKQERTALIRGKDVRQMEREGYPSDPYVMYSKAKEIGNMRSGWAAVTMALDGVGVKRDLERADQLWRDYWCTQVLPAFEDRREIAFESL